MAEIPSFEDFKKTQGGAIPSFDEFKAQQAATPPPGLLPGMPNSNVASRIASAAGESMNPLPLLLGNPVHQIKSLVTSPIEAGKRVFNAAKAANTGEMLKSAPGMIPLIGPAAEQITREASGGQIPEAIGHVAGGLASMELPKVLGKGMEAAAPGLAESALGIGKADRAYERRPGEAILQDTSGVRPSTIAKTGRETLSRLTPQLESAARANAGNMVDLTPSRDIVRDARLRALSENTPEIAGHLDPLTTRLTVNASNKLPLSRLQSPETVLNLKRGVNKADVGNWNPELASDTSRDTAKKVYGKLNEGFESAVPGAAALNQRISSLIPGVDKADSVSRNPSPLQSAMHRIAAHTGALAGSALGYHEAGIPGAVAGLVIPEMMTSPTAQMAGARALYGAGKAFQSPAAKAIGTAIPLESLNNKRKGSGK